MIKIKAETPTWNAKLQVIFDKIGIRWYSLVGQCADTLPGGSCWPTVRP